MKHFLRPSESALTDPGEWHAIKPRVPYKGAGLSTTDLLGGQVQLMFNPAAPLLPHVSSGRLRALAVGNEKRSRIVPDLPTVAEAGVPGFVSAPWCALYAPARTPAAVIDVLNA